MHNQHINITCVSYRGIWPFRLRSYVYLNYVNLKYVNLKHINITYVSYRGIWPFRLRMNQRFGGGSIIERAFELPNIIFPAVYIPHYTFPAQNWSTFFGGAPFMNHGFGRGSIIERGFVFPNIISWGAGFPAQNWSTFINQEFTGAPLHSRER